MSTTHDTITGNQFGPRAQAYVASAVHASGPDLDRIEAIARDHPEGRALDLGCGGGHVSYRIAPYASEVVASDLSSEMLGAVAAEAGRRGIGNIATVQAAAEGLPFDNDSFDLLACRMSAHHWRHFEAGLREARRVLRRGAPALFVDVIAPAEPLFDTHLQAIELLRDPSHVRDYRTDEWCAALARSGFALQSFTVHRLRMEFATWIARMRTDAAHAAAIHSLQRGASAEVMDALAIEDDGSFMLDIATFELVAA
jgi:SAM-dependent methyltransferase